MFYFWLKTFEDELKELDEEQSLMLFEMVKTHLIDLQKRKLAELENEQAPILDNTRYNPRKRAAPKHKGYYANQGIDENNVKRLVVWSKWSQGRPPKAFEGLTPKELDNCKISDEEFAVYVKKALDGDAEGGSEVVIVKSNLGYDAEGRSLEAFHEYQQMIGRAVRTDNASSAENETLPSTEPERSLKLLNQFQTSLSEGSKENRLTSDDIKKEMDKLTDD